MTKTILFIGGGSLGHVTPSIAVADVIHSKNLARIVFAVGTRSDEATLVRASGYECHVLSAPKFPRGLTLRYLTFPFSFCFALTSSLALLLAVRPSAVFAKGGFVSVPLSFVAWCMRIPVVMHTSDSVPNMSDRFLMRIASRVCTGFPLESLGIPHIHTGNPVRAMVRQGSREEGKRITGFTGSRPVLLVIGGSQGSLDLNQTVIKHFDELVQMVDIIHLTGSGKETTFTHPSYFARAEVTTELPHLYALADLVLTRAGAGVLSELAALKKTALVTPLMGVAHDHQLLNAEYLVDAGAVYHVPGSQLPMLSGIVTALLHDTEMMRSMGEALGTCFPADASEQVSQALLDVLGSD
ncbi:MAG: UDP-N-acetylglucosamine--N-acetylmuramyl-(pentapeptide) pyrophosphoryl-undecaprenol N-acetylglucosamine transferase [Candidatus Peribacteraceae bacterium]